MKFPSRVLASFVLGYSLDGSAGPVLRAAQQILRTGITLEELLMRAADEPWTPTWGRVRRVILARHPDLGTLPPYEPPEEGGEAARRYREGFAAGVEARFGAELELGP